MRAGAAIVRPRYCAGFDLLVDFDLRGRAEFMRSMLAAAAGAALFGLAGCSEEAPPAEPVRPVRTVTVEHRPAGERVALSGQIEAAETVALSFRIGGKLNDRLVSVDDRLIAGQVVARLDPQDAESELRGARAELAAAQATLAQAEADEARQRELLQKNVIAQARYDQATQQLETARSQVEAANAQLKAAEDKVSYTELRADGAGTVIATGAEAGEVVASGQMIVSVAREGARDAVFNVPAQLLRTAPRDPEVMIALAEDPSVTARGRVREVAPQADPATRTFEVKVAIENPPEPMRLGATVVGAIVLDSAPVISIPATALVQSDGDAAVWVVDQAGAVSLRAVTVARYDTDSVIVAEGLSDGENVVTAGVQALRPGQKVRLLTATP
jgi:RND family efflux transporter MFP subunit